MMNAAALFRPAFDASGGADGWVSLEVSPLLADDTAATIAQAKAFHARAACPNLFIKIPGNRAGIPAIERAPSPRHRRSPVGAKGGSAYRRGAAPQRRIDAP